MTPLENAELVIDLEQRARDSVERLESLVVLKNVRLATKLETCEALLRGEKVHRSRLDPEWVRRYGGK